MAYEANQQYQVSVSGAGLTHSSQGRPGLELYFTHPDHGEIKEVLWISEKTQERVDKTLREVFGIAPERYENPLFYEEADMYLNGKQCFIITVQEVWKDKPRIRVQWINKEPKKATENVDKATLARKAAEVMRKGRAAAFAESAPAPIDDGDVPF
jgi:hypothetical protein